MASLLKQVGVLLERIEEQLDCVAELPTFFEAVLHGLQLPIIRRFGAFRGAYRDKLSIRGVTDAASKGAVRAETSSRLETVGKA